MADAREVEAGWQSHEEAASMRRDAPLQLPVRWGRPSTPGTGALRVAGGRQRGWGSWESDRQPLSCLKRFC